MKMNWTPVCALTDIVVNTGVGALLEGRQIALFRLEDERVFAIDNFDPHSQANVLARGLVGDLNGEIVVASPIYKQHFRLSDGVCLEDASRSVAAHDVQIVEGQVLVQLRDDVATQAA